MHKQTRMQGSWLIAAIGVGCASAFAGSATFNFDTDPTAQGLTISGNHAASAWVQTGGNPGGYLSISDAVGSQVTSILFPDFDQGLVVKAFTLSADLRIGDGTSDQPADGFSINYARAEDPLVAHDGDPAYYTDPLKGLDGGAETGSSTGVAVCFDAWSGNPLPDTSDLRGIEVRVDDVTVLKYAMDTLDPTDPTDISSLQTGPKDPNNAGDASTLTWQPLKVELDENQQLTVQYKNQTLLDHYQTSFFPSPGRIVMGGRTGGSNQNQHVDNLTITTIPASVPLINAATATPVGFTITVSDSGTTADTNTLNLKLNNTSVTPNRVTKSGATTTIAYWDLTHPFPPGTTNVVNLSLKDSAGNDIGPEDRQAVVPAYVTLSEEQAVTVDTSKPGFKYRFWEIAQDQYTPLGSTLDNTVARAEQELAGLLGPNYADTNTPPILFSDNGYYDVTGVINYSRWDSSGVSEPRGDWQTSNGYDDVPLPGTSLLIGATDGSIYTDNTAAEILTYLYFPEVGVYSLVFNSDDGFRMTTAPNPREVLSSGIVCQFDGGRGATDTAGLVYVTHPGYYGFRAVWFNGDGDANMEWSGNETIPTANPMALINDSKTSTAIKAYREATSPAPPAVTFVKPVRDSGAPWLPNTTIQATIVDGATAVVSSSVQLTVNGKSVTPAVNKSGTTTTVSYTPPATNVLASGTNVVTLTFEDNASPAQQYQDTLQIVAASYLTLPVSLWSDLNSVDTTKPGFRYRVVQTDTVNENSVAQAEIELAGGELPNVAGDFGAQADGYGIVTGVINFNGDTSADIGNFQSPDYPDAPFPGLPGADNRTGDPAAEVLTYVVFPTPGYYVMGVNSDDGFRVSCATNQDYPVNLVHINSPSSIGGNMVAIEAAFDPPLNQLIDVGPITADVVESQPLDDSGALTNADALKGKIALIDRGAVSFAQMVTDAQAAGAVAVIVADQQTTSDRIITMGGAAVPGSATLPAVEINYTSGAKLHSTLQAGTTVNATLQSHPYTNLGVYNGGRGSSDTLFGINVQKAGVYPMRLVWENGDGELPGNGFNLEWFMIDQAGNHVLLNDANTASALKTYRERTFTPPSTPTISITTSAGTITVTYTGTLQSADSVTGPWTDLSGASSPYAVSTSGAAMKFYRAKQ